jgi:hypothetical protein
MEEGTMNVRHKGEGPRIGILLLLFFTALSLSFADVIHVSISTGNNSNAGTADAPKKNIDKAIAAAKAGDTIKVAEGVYSGTFAVGYLTTDKPLVLMGGYSADFSSRDVVGHPTLFQPDNASGAKSRKALLTLTKNVDGMVVDGFIFDMGMRNSYSPAEGRPEGVETGMLLLPPQKASGENATVTEQCLSIASGNTGGEITIRNNVFLNGANFAVQAGVPKGTLTIRNNVFVSNRMAAIEVWGTSASQVPNAEIDHNTILFTWSRLKDFKDMGYGIRIMTKMKYNIHHNIIGTSVLTGVDHTRFNPDANINLDENLFFLNKQSDMQYSPASNTKLNLSAGEFGDLELASVKGNRNEIPKGLPLEAAYLEGFLSARYTETADYDPDSAANQIREMLGLNKQGKLTTAVSMFGNRYPWKKALELFGAVAGVGAQIPK